jgi:hypothetical protein
MSGPVIYNVTVDSAVSYLTISGTNFVPASSAPLVEFNGSNLTVTSYSNTSIVATLPSGLATGTYALEVSNSDNFSCPEKIDVDISEPPSCLFGFTSPGVDTMLVGYATNLHVSSTAITFPAVGVTPSAGGIVYDPAGISGSYLRIVLSSPLPSAAGTLSVFIYDTTHNYSSGTATISSAGVKGVSGSVGFSVNPGDQILMVVSVSGSPVVLPSLQWTLYS